MRETTNGVAAGVVCAAAVSVMVLAAGCAPPSVPDGSANAAAVPATAGTAVTGSPAQWQSSVCRDDIAGEIPRDSGTRHTTTGTACVPADGDGTVNFDHFESVG